MRTSRSKTLIATLILPLCGLVSLASCGQKTENSTLGKPEPSLTPSPTKITANAPQVPQVPEETAPVPIDTTAATPVPAPNAVDTTVATPVPAPNAPGVTVTSTTVATTRKVQDDPDDQIPPFATPPPVTPLTNSLVTQENLDRVHKDMSPADVVAILGRPTNSQTTSIPILGGTETSYHYETYSSTVDIIFRNNLVKFKNGNFGN